MSRQAPLETFTAYIVSLFRPRSHVLFLFAFSSWVGPSPAKVVKDPRPGVGFWLSGMWDRDVRTVGPPRKQLFLMYLLSSYHRCEFKIPLAVKKGECRVSFGYRGCGITFLC